MLKNSEIQAEVEKVMRLRRRLEEVAARHPEADPENIWHTLVLLEETPVERLRSALRRGRASLLW